MKNCPLNVFSIFAALLAVCTCSADLQNKPTAGLQQQYEYHCNTPSDIYEHIPVLRQLSQECSSAVEIGVRSMVSTWGILLGLAENNQSERTYLGIDLAYPPPYPLSVAKKLAAENGIDFTFWPTNDMHIDLEPVDLLFIDSLHTYCHLTYELETFCPKVRKYICMHDTSPPWENRDDTEYHGDYSEYPAEYDRTKRGLWPAVVDFLERHPEWSLYERRINNHGFTILKRNDESLVPHPVYHPLVNHYLKNKIILCTGPSRGKYDMLKKHTEADLNVVPFKKIFLTTNDANIMSIDFFGRKPVTQLINDWGHQLDCLNCIITTLKNAVNDPEVDDDDIILFKHETLFINDLYLFKKSVSQILEGNDMVARSWIVPNSRTRATDAFFVKVSSVREIVKDMPIVTTFTHHDPYCEMYFTSHIVYKLAKVYDVVYHHSNWKFGELGFYHIPRLPHDIIGYWDKSNYYNHFPKDTE